MLTPSPCVATAAPDPITSADALESWLEKQRLPVGTVEQIPPAWRNGLMSLPQGFVARIHGGSAHLFRFVGKEIQPFFPEKEQLPQGQIFFLADAS